MEISDNTMRRNALTMDTLQDSTLNVRAEALFEYVFILGAFVVVDDIECYYINIIYLNQFLLI